MVENRKEKGSKRKTRESDKSQSSTGSEGKRVKKNKKNETKKIKKADEVEEKGEEEQLVFVYEGSEEQVLEHEIELDDSDSDEELVWDPEVSYVGVKTDSKQEKKNVKEAKPQRKRWIKKGKPIVNRNKIPKEWKWTDEEPDLDIDDIDAQIQRCKERIEDGVLPVQFQHRLAEYENLKAGRDMIMARFPNHSYEVAQRLQELTTIEKELLVEGDEDEHLPNIRSLLKAYKSGELQWYDGLVTYWSHGKQLCQPRPFDWDEFLRVNKKHHGYCSFWVEGINPPGPMDQFLHIRRFDGPSEPWHLLFKFYQVQVPGYRAGAGMSFRVLDDTGSSTLTLYKADIVALQGNVTAITGRAPRKPPLIGVANFTQADGTSLRTNIISVEVNVMDNNIELMLPKYVRVQCCVYPDPPPPLRPVRLSGRWLRDILYTATVPDGTRELFAFDTADGLQHVRPRATRRVLAPKNRTEPPGLQLEEFYGNRYAY